MAEPVYVPPRFGTDGLRGPAGRPPIDPETMRRIGGALGIWLQQRGPEQKRVLLGHDGRASAAWIAANLTQGLAAAEVGCIDVGLVPTPALAFLCRTQPVQAGIMISASHNPAADNGIKIFRGDGTKLDDAAETEIAALSDRVDFAVVAAARARPPRTDLLRSYEEHLANAFPELDLSGRRIAIDAAHGAASEVAPAVLRAFGAELVTIGCRPDGENINAGVGALHPTALAERVRAERAGFGICLDGDGDRCVLVDESGAVHDGDAILARMGPAMLRAGELPAATVVATVMSNVGLRQALAAAGIHLHETAVGDRAVVQAMRTQGYALGGEQSGHIVFGGPGHLTGDGLFTALKVMATPGFWEYGAAAALGGFVRFPQALINVPVTSKPPLEGVAPIQAAVAEATAALGPAGRVLLRYSGTEALCRVMVEAATDDQVVRLARRIATAVERELGGPG